MIKPEVIKTTEFDMSVLGGYKRESVDSFLNDLYVDYEKLYNENIELAKKLKVCVEKIEEYQKDERFLKAAIINAEKLNETSVKEIEAREKEIERVAKEKADSLVEKARIEAENIMKTARFEAADSIRKCEAEAAEKITRINAEVAFENEKLLTIKKEVSEFKDTILKIYKSHLESLSNLPEYTPKEVYTPKESVKEEIIEKTETVPEAEETENLVENKPIEHDSQAEKTAEFVLEKKNSDSEKQKSFDEHFKFQELKFGTDFNVESDE